MNGSRQGFVVFTLRLGSYLEELTLRLAPSCVVRADALGGPHFGGLLGSFPPGFSQVLCASAVPPPPQRVRWGEEGPCSPAPPLTKLLLCIPRLCGVQRLQPGSMCTVKAVLCLLSSLLGLVPSAYLLDKDREKSIGKWGEWERARHLLKLPLCRWDRAGTRASEQCNCVLTLPHLLPCPSALACRLYLGLRKSVWCLKASIWAQSHLPRKSTES